MFVTGHEMGHYVLGHVRDGILFSCAVLLFFSIWPIALLHWMLARWGETWAIRGPDDLASLPVLILLLTVFGFLFTPISNAYSRHLEHQADQYGLEVIHGLVPDAPGGGGARVSNSRRSGSRGAESLDRREILVLQSSAAR